MNCPNCMLDLTEYHPENDIWTCQNCGWLWHQGVIADVQDPPRKAYRCPSCSAWLHFIGTWHCYNCGSDWETDYCRGDESELVKALNIVREVSYVDAD